MNTKILQVILAVLIAAISENLDRHFIKEATLLNHIIKL